MEQTKRLRQKINENGIKQKEEIAETIMTLNSPESIGK